ncbi:hypothetical protein MKW98_007504 [Papaver atlanticum]|uniref:Pentatricopeptide repeat-containing protein n=1 Tax=Papaver atlanticum TaxID=357466 RepID=A0AAD4SDE3_9MAGN|nr:hypothetical protein MKW98_007504 [Papaver atlanticum]
MGAKCGNLGLAKNLFDGMQERDVICWNVIISGLTMNGDAENALALFEQMEKDGITYKGLQIFDSMKSVYGIEPKSEHYGCMINLLDRARLVKLERQCGVYVLLSNMHAGFVNMMMPGEQGKDMKERGVEKTPGCSSIEVNGFIHEFVASEKTHPQMEEVHKVLEKMTDQLEYRPQIKLLI